MPSVAFAVFACFAVLASSAADVVVNRCNKLTATPNAPCTLAQAPGIWTTPAELAAIPMSGVHWERMIQAADAPVPVLGPAKPPPNDVIIGGATGSPDGLHNQNSLVDTNVLAAALAYARLSTVPAGTTQAAALAKATTYRNKVANTINLLINTENGGRSLAAGRNIVSIVCAADLIKLSAYTAINTKFVEWLRVVRSETLGIPQGDPRSIIGTHNVRPNNWGTMNGASRIAADIYLGDWTDLALAIKTFRGYLGDRTAYATFTYGDLSWQFDRANPRGINPAGAKITVSGALRNVDGVLPDDLRRAGVFVWPPPKEMYVWEALQGAVVQARLLYRRGYESWSWSDRAICRAAHWQTFVALFPAAGDDQWQNWVLNRACNPTQRFAEPAVGFGAGKNMGFTSWMLSLPGAREDMTPEEMEAEALAKQAAHTHNLMILGAATVVVAVVVLAAGLFVWKKRQQTQHATAEYIHMSEVMAES